MASKSIMQETKECAFCGRTYGLVRHHCCHGTANRSLAEKDGLWVWLCNEHHTGSNDSVHHNRAMDLLLLQRAQSVYESTKGTREEFRKRYGKSWL